MDLSKNLVVPATLALAILGGVYGFGRQSSRAEQLETAFAKFVDDSATWRAAAEKRDKDHADQINAIREQFGTRVTAMEVTVANMNQTLGRIEGKIDRGGVVQAGGRAR